MKGNRLTGYKSLIDNIGAPVCLITENNLAEFNDSSSPMHPIVLESGLSRNHLSDYLRAYFMHHYGGGYHDVKPHAASGNWAKYFSNFANASVWMAGIKEQKRYHIACDESYVLDDARCDAIRSVDELKKASDMAKTMQGSQGKCCGLVTNSWKESLLMNGAYIMRPQTSMTKEWLQNIETHVNAKFEELKAHPAPYPRCCNPSKAPYPFRWAELHGEAFHPLQWKYSKHLNGGLSQWASGPYRDDAEEIPLSRADYKMKINV
jgi:hypothetical protein